MNSVTLSAVKGFVVKSRDLLRPGIKMWLVVNTAKVAKMTN